MQLHFASWYVSRKDDITHDTLSAAPPAIYDIWNNSYMALVVLCAAPDD